MIPLQAESASGASYSSMGASFSQSPETALSPLHTRAGAESKYRDDRYVSNIINYTRINSPILTIVKKNKTEVFPSILRLFNNGKMSIIELWELVNGGHLKFKEALEQENKEYNLTLKCLEHLAKLEKYQNRLVFFKHTGSPSP